MLHLGVVPSPNRIFEFLDVCLTVRLCLSVFCHQSVGLGGRPSLLFQGSLRVTVFACGPGESPPSPGEELEDSDDENQGFIDDLRNVVIDNRRKQCGCLVT